MKPVILIEAHNIDLFVEAKVLGLCGITELFTFNNVKAALRFLRDNNLPEVIFLMDLQLLLEVDLEDFDAVSKLYQQNKNFPVYLLATLAPDAKSSITPITNFANGLIDKPLTVEKVKEILGVK